MNRRAILAGAVLAAVFPLLLEAEQPTPRANAAPRRPDVSSQQSAEAAQRPMTNADVVALVEAGLPDAVIVEKIRTSTRAFDTSTEGLIALRKASVSTWVVQVMVNPDAAPAAGAAVQVLPGSGLVLAGGGGGPEPCAAMANGQLPWMSGASPAMWYAQAGGGERLELQYERGTLHRVGFMGIGATLLLLKPKAAHITVAGDTVFYSCMNPTEAPLVKFSVDDEDDDRHTSVARGGPWNQSFRISDGDLVPMVFKKLPQGIFEVKPRTPMTPGQYGFVPQAGHSYFVAGERVYAFGVE